MIDKKSECGEFCDWADVIEQLKPLKAKAEDETVHNIAVKYFLMKD